MTGSDQGEPMIESLSAALRYAVRGWRVVPLDGKIPFLKDWPRIATTQPQTIQAWWREYPHANVGIATGRETGLLVLDVDPANGGDDSLRTLEERCGKLPTTVEVMTGGGGRHLYFQHPGCAVGNSSGKLGPGLDIRTDGGQVVAPPSIHPDTGRTYEWEGAHHPDDVQPATVPQWFLDLLTAKPKAVIEPTRQTFPEGQRNDSLAREAGRLRRMGLSGTELQAVLLAMNQERCQPPLPADEVCGIAASIARYEPKSDSHSWSSPMTGGPQETEFSPLAVNEFLDTAIHDGTVEWVLEDYLPAGGLVLLAGKPKEGKTTLTYELAINVARGMPFLGRATQRAGVLILGLEEHPRDMRLRLRSLVSDGLCDLFVFAKPLSTSSENIEKIKRFVVDRSVKLILVDTLGAFWNVKDENNAAEVTRAMKPLLALARESGACVLLIHHARKSEGSYGDEIRGSGALFASVDIALILKRHEIQTQRTLLAVGRYPDTPSEMVIELRDGGYVSLGDPALINRQAKRDKMKAILTDDWKEPKVLAQKAGVPVRDSYRLLAELRATGEADQTGEGKRGSPFQYRRHSIHATPPVLGGGLHETNSRQASFDSCGSPSPPHERESLH